MPLTKDFRETIRERAQKDRSFRQALLREGVELMLAGDLAVGKALLRDYINATMGFPGLANMVSTPASSLMRMFDPKGNPSASNLLGVIAVLQKQEGINLVIRAVRS